MAGNEMDNLNGYSFVNPQWLAGLYSQFIKPGSKFSLKECISVVALV